MSKVIGKTKVRGSRVIGAKEKFQGLVTIPTNTYTVTNNQYLVIVDDAGNITKRQTTYVHTQNSVSNTWVVAHNLKAFPAVAVVNSGGSNVIGEVTYNSALQVTIVFSSAFSGTAYFN
tara:strand:+ start:2749 stop:3102 length:354 start_codon:yes stop_codon:yes gene_type:complete